MLSEFDLIKQYFRRARAGHTGHAGHVVLGIGDDCALLAPTPGMQTAISTDLLVEGRHFFAGAPVRRTRTVEFAHAFRIRPHQTILSPRP